MRKIAAGLLALANLQISLDELNEAEGILDRLAFHMPDDVDVNIGFAELSKAQKIGMQPLVLHPRWQSCIRKILKLES